MSEPVLHPDPVPETRTAPKAGTREWDASTYDRVSAPQLQWGEEVLGRLPLRGDETVLDAGCGSGRVTELVIARLPRGRVIALDASEAMVEQARSRLRVQDRAVVGDLLELDLGEPVDAVFSTAAFHWIADHDRLFARLAAALRPGGRLEAQCGGVGNIARFRAAADAVGREDPFAAQLRDFRHPWYYADAEQTEQRLARAGFADVRCWLEPRMTRPPEPRTFIRTVCLAPMLDELPAQLQEPFLDGVLERCGEPFELDYVRLNLEGVRA